MLARAKKDLTEEQAEEHVLLAIRMMINGTGMFSSNVVWTKLVRCGCIPRGLLTGRGVACFLNPSMYDQLKAYKETYGDCLVPKRYKENPKLGTWIDTQRVQYKKLKKKLESQGKTVLDPEGESAPASGSDEDIPRIAESTTPEAAITAPMTSTASGALTMAPKPLVGRLTDERIRRLNDLGFAWSLRDDWGKHYDELVGTFLVVRV